VRYCITREKDRSEFLDILRKTGGGYYIRLTRTKDGCEKIIEEFISKQLFDICLNTGYIKPETAGGQLSA
jgi:hypothetical protein